MNEGLDMIVAALDDHAAKTPAERGARIEYRCPNCGKESWSYECYLNGITVEEGVAILEERHRCRPVVGSEERT